MPILIKIDSAIRKWEYVHDEFLTYSDLAKRAGMSLATLNRLKSSELTNPDLRKINTLCKVLECEPGDLLRRVDTSSLEEEAEVQQLINDIKAAETEDPME